MALTLEDQFAFYGAYHNNKWNQLIHLIFVPVIMWSAFVWGAYTGPLVTLSALKGLPFASYIVLNFAFFAWLGYAIYYFTLSPVASIPWSIFLLFLQITATQFYVAAPLAAWKYAAVAHVFGWYMQIHIGHILIEKRKAALTDSFFQSLIMAPLFVYFELLFALGFFPEFKAKVQKRIDSEIAVWKASQKKAN